MIHFKREVQRIVEDKDIKNKSEAIRFFRKCSEEIKELEIEVDKIGNQIVSIQSRIDTEKYNLFHSKKYLKETEKLLKINIKLKEYVRKKYKLTLSDFLKE